MVVSHTKLFAEQTQDKAASGIRVVAAHKKAVLEALSRASTFKDADELAEQVALAVLGAEDNDEVRYCVVTQTPTKDIDVYGPYLNPGAAQRAIDDGWCAHTANTRGVIVPIIMAPKRTRRKMPAAKRVPAKSKQQRQASL